MKHRDERRRKREIKKEKPVSLYPSCIAIGRFYRANWQSGLRNERRRNYPRG